MRLVIDGYNLFHVAMQKGNIKDKQSFIAQIAQYKNIKKHEIVLVFDGGNSVYETEEYKHGMLIIHSGYAQTADLVVIDLIKREKGIEIVVITSDREIRKEADRNRIPSITSELFYEILLDRIFVHRNISYQRNKKDIVTKTTVSQNVLVDELMMQQVPREPKDEAVVQHEEHVNHQTVRKEEKAIAQIIKKL